MSSLDRFIGILSGIPATAIAGIFLVLSFALPRAGYQEYEALAWICVIICGIPLLYLSVWRIIHNRGISKISSALLITIAMGAALYIGDLFAAGEVAFIMQIGAILEDMTVNRSKKGLKNLISSIPETGRRVENGKETEIPVSEIRVGDIIRVKPGETIHVDGTVISGETAVNQAAMTGESIPADKTRGSSVFSGTVNLYGSVDIAATKRGEDSSLQKIVKLIEEADGKQADTQRIADKWASWLVPLASLVAVAAYFLTGEIVRAVTVLVVFCPCALVLSTPTAISAAIGQATKHGVMIKSGLALEKLGSAKTICFDKTGTLTEGTLKVDSVDLQARISENELLSIAASAELRSEHPVGKAIVKEAESRNIRVPQPESFSARPGIGVEADIGGKRYTVKKADSGMRTGGRTAVSVFSGDKILGTVFLSDSLRPETASAVSELSGMGVKTVLLTGDRRDAAELFASRAGISEVHADLLPEDKLRFVESGEGIICMVGDGINDAPALKAADVGIAMGAMGSDLAIDSADIALMSDDISGIPYLKWLASETVKTIRTAITVSMCINFVAVSASVLGMLNPTTGALVHNAGSCFVVLLAALMYDKKYPGEKRIRRGSPSPDI